MQHVIAKLRSIMNKSGQHPEVMRVCAWTIGALESSAQSEAIDAKFKEVGDILAVLNNTTTLHESRLTQLEHQAVPAGGES